MLAIAGIGLQVDQSLLPVSVFEYFVNLLYEIALGYQLIVVAVGRLDPRPASKASPGLTSIRRA